MTPGDYSFSAVDNDRPELRSRSVLCAGIAEPRSNRVPFVRAWLSPRNRRRAQH